MPRKLANVRICEEIRRQEVVIGFGGNCYKWGALDILEASFDFGGDVCGFWGWPVARP